MSVQGFGEVLLHWRADRFYERTRLNWVRGRGRAFPPAVLPALVPSMSKLELLYSQLQGTLRARVMRCLAQVHA